MAYEKLYLPRKVAEMANELKEDYQLSMYESLDIALKIERNQLIERAFVLTDSDEVTALEKIVHTLEDINKN